MCCYIPASDDDDDDDGSGSLSSGVIIAAAVGGAVLIIVIVAIILVVFFCVRKSQLKKAYPVTSSRVSSQGTIIAVPLCLSYKKYHFLFLFLLINSYT